MSDFLFYINVGLKHVLDWQAYDHVLFLIVLTVFYNFKNWKSVLWLITAFTIGHTLSLTLAAYNLIHVKIEIIEFLIPLTILVTAIYNIATVNKTVHNIKINSFFAMLFGLVHGIGFSSYFTILVDKTSDKLLPLVEFALGIEIAQIVVVFFVLILAFMVLHILKKSKRDWVLVVSSIVIGIIIPMLIERKFW